MKSSFFSLGGWLQWVEVENRLEQLNFSRDSSSCLTSLAAPRRSSVSPFRRCRSESARTRTTPVLAETFVANMEANRGTPLESEIEFFIHRALPERSEAPNASGWGRVNGGRMVSGADKQRCGKSE
jgi:hypothetical protein